MISAVESSRRYTKVSSTRGVSSFEREHAYCLDPPRSNVHVSCNLNENGFAPSTSFLSLTNLGLHDMSPGEFATRSLIVLFQPTFIKGRGSFSFARIFLTYINLGSPTSGLEGVCRCVPIFIKEKYMNQHSFMEAWVVLYLLPDQYLIGKIWEYFKIVQKPMIA